MNIRGHGSILWRSWLLICNWSVAKGAFKSEVNDYSCHQWEASKDPCTVHGALNTIINWCNKILCCYNVLHHPGVYAPIMNCIVTYSFDSLTCNEKCQYIQIDKCAECAPFLRDLILTIFIPSYYFISQALGWGIMASHAEKFLSYALAVREKRWPNSLVATCLYRMQTSMPRE